MTSSLGVPVAPFPGDDDFLRQPSVSGDLDAIAEPLRRAEAALAVLDGLLPTVLAGIERKPNEQGHESRIIPVDYKDAQKTASKVLTLPEMLAEEQAMLRKVNPPRIKIDDIEMSFTCWRRTIQACAVLHKTRRIVGLKEVIEFDPSLKPYEKHIIKLFETPQFHEALRIRGVDAPFTGLSERQIAGINAAVNVMDKRALSAKLRALGIKDWEWNQWQANPRFRDLYRKLGEQLFDELQPQVNSELGKLATSGDLSAIKYFNELSGRWNPDTKAVMNIREFMQKVVEIITTEIHDPELLAKLGTRLTSLAATSGAYREDDLREIGA